MATTQHEKFVTLEDIQAAQQIIAGRVQRTPMLFSATLGERLGVQLHFKAELFQKTGSFKVRGALNKMHHLTDDEKRRGVIAVSAGNHAAGLAYAAKQYGVQATIVMPEFAVRSKVEATEYYGGKVVLHGGMNDIFPKMYELKEQYGLTLVHPFDDPYIIAGQGTVALEILDDVPTPDVVVVPVGGGGLLCGVAVALKALRPQIRVIGVEPEGSNALTQSIKANRVVHIEHNKTIADGLAAPFAGENTLAHAKRFVDEIVLVSDAEIIEALWLIMERCKVMSETGGAAAFAALLYRKFDVPEGAKVVCILSGGNVDRSRLKEML